MIQLSNQPHPYIVALKHHFTTKGQKSSDEVYLNLVLEYVPETIYSVSKHYNRRKEPIPIFSIKLYMYQLARALGHIHGMGICHRYNKDLFEQRNIFSIIKNPSVLLKQRHKTPQSACGPCSTSSEIM